MCTSLGDPLLSSAWQRPFAGAQQSPGKPAAPIAQFLDVAEKSGHHDDRIFSAAGHEEVHHRNHRHRRRHLRLRQRWLARHLPREWHHARRTFRQDKTPTNHLYRNNHDGTFTDVTEPAGLAGSPAGDRARAWATTTTTAGKTSTSPTTARTASTTTTTGVFTEVAEKSGVGGSGKAWGTGCAFVDYDRDGLLDLVVANYVDFDLATAPAPGERASCVWKGVPVMCGPRGLPAAKNILYHNLGDGKFADVSHQGAHRPNSRPLLARRRHVRLRRRRLARHLRRLRQHGQHSLSATITTAPSPMSP